MDVNVAEVVDALAASHRLTSQEILQVLEKSFADAWQAVYGEGYKISLDIADKQICLFREVEIVEAVTDVKTQIKGPEIGKVIKEKLNIDSLPRNTIMSIYDSIGREIKNIHKIREYELYKDQVGKLFKYQVKKVSGRNIILNVANVYDGIIPHYLANQRERFTIGEYIQCRLAEVNFNIGDYQLIFERKTKEFISALMAEFIPEIAAGAVVVKNIAREAGSLCKILVASEGSVNAVGACLGLKGKRRMDIVKELKGEKIDFIAYHDNLIIQLKECFKCKKIDLYKVNIIDEDNIEVVVEDEKVPEAIGKRGQNIFLTKRLLNKQISIISLTDFKAKEDDRITVAAKDLEQFDISQEDAIHILTKYQSIQNALYDESLDENLIKKIKNYLQNEEDKERQYYVESGGEENFFMSLNNLPSYVYFQLLECGIANKQDLDKFSSADDLHANTGIDVDICILLMENL